MKEERIQNITSVNRAAIESFIADGKRVVLQYVDPCYTPKLLQGVNNLCGEFGKALEVRFLGHHGGHRFDASILRYLPDVASLSVDCLFGEVINLCALNDLANLRQLSLGVYKLNDQNFLKSLQLQNLECLSLCETEKVNLDLSPLKNCNNLTELYLDGHTKNIDCLSNLSALQSLSLRRIPKKQSLDFISKIPLLKRLFIALGGRASIAEVQHSLLEELELVLVLGFNNFDNVGAFPSLRSLKIEDQIQLENLRFTASNKNIQSIRIWNCKTLRNLKGLEHLTELKSLSIGMTALDVDSILHQRLASSLKAFTFGAGTRKKSEDISKKLDALGYRQPNY